MPVTTRIVTFLCRGSLLKVTCHVYLGKPRHPQISLVILSYLRYHASYQTNKQKKQKHHFSHLILCCTAKIIPVLSQSLHQFTQTYQVLPKPMGSRCSLVLLQRDSNQYLGKGYHSYGSYGTMWPTFDFFWKFWHGNVLFKCGDFLGCWCMASCFQGSGCIFIFM